MYGFLLPRGSLKSSELSTHKSKRANIAVFIPHMGCPHKCSFCNQGVITGAGEKLRTTPDDVTEIIKVQILSLKKQNKKAEIAFFGGTFTALERGYMISLLEAARKCAERYPEVICGLRCSTRPDAVDGETLAVLREYGMTAVELGAQSMDDGVLNANMRGHTSDDTKKAAVLIKNYGFELGLQMMTGLYRDSPELDIRTAEEFLCLKPDTVRIYPVVIMPDTKLAELFLRGEYTGFDFETTLDLCAGLYGMFTENGVRVIRIGLNTEAEVEKKAIGGNYHPAMGELCISRYFFYKMREFMLKSGAKRFIIETDKRFVSKITGQKSLNRKLLEKYGFDFEISEKNGELPIIRVK